MSKRRKSNPQHEAKKWERAWTARKRAQARKRLDSNPTEGWE